MEHPENSSEYKGLTVNSGVAQPSIVNPYLKRGRFRHREYSVDEMVEGLLRGDVTILSQAVTLVESVNPEHQAKAQEVIEKCLPYSGKSVRIGISGVFLVQERVPLLMSLVHTCLTLMEANLLFLPLTLLLKGAKAVFLAIRQEWRSYLPEKRHSYALHHQQVPLEEWRERPARQ